MPEVVEVVKSVVLVAGVRTAGERDHRRRDERGDAPAEELEDPLRDQHHREGDRARRRREGAHELGVRGAHRVEGAKFDGAHPSGAGAACANRNCGRVLSATRGVSAMPPAVARRPTAKTRRCSIIKRGGNEDVV